MGILNRWRQFGRRYFWPHLLLGVVAAGFGVPLFPGGGQEMLHQAFSRASWQSAFQAGFSQLARLKDVPRRPAYAVDYWHQHAIRTVIRHLSIAWSPAPEAVAPLRVQHQVLLTTLGLLFNREAWQPMLVRLLRQTGHVAFIDHRSGIPSGPAAGNTRRPVCGCLTLKDCNFPANDFLAADGRGHDEI